MDIFQLILQRLRELFSRGGHLAVERPITEALGRLLQHLWRVAGPLQTLACNLKPGLHDTSYHEQVTVIGDGVSGAPGAS